MTMLISTVLSTLLCASLVDARLAPVNSAEALALCLKQPNCYSPALEINPATFHPVIKASPPVEVRLNIAVKSNQPLTFLVHAENTAVRWEITRPSDTCLWEISSDGKGAVTFREISGSRVNLYQLFVGYNVDLGSDVNISVRREGTDNFVDVTGNFNHSPLPGKLSACAYAQPDSDSIPDWEIWTISVSASETSDPSAHIELNDAYVVYDAPEKPTAPQCGSACLECVRSMLSSDTN